MPEKWFSNEYQERREKCQVPEDLQFKTKNQIGLELIRKALDTELFPVGWVGFDAGFGSDSKFRDAVDSLRVNYLGDIKSNTLVWLNRPKVGIPAYSGRGRRPEKERVLGGEEPAIHVSDIAKVEMKRAVTMRWPIEQCFEDGKKYLGMDHYEHRSWPGRHRHMTNVILAMLFLLRLRFKFKKKSLR